MRALNYCPVLPVGYTVRGRWEQRHYRIERLLGRGGTGLVYLVSDEKGEPRAMKITGDLMGITHEHRMLVYLNRLKGTSELEMIPEIYELDDFQIGGEVYNFTITQYCPGKGLDRIKGRLTQGDIALIGSRVAKFLNSLHREGLVYGDLKPGNILYDRRKGDVYIIDFGSVTIKGQYLKQYTPGYDRAGWEAGTRIADELYDTFALGILLASLNIGKLAGIHREKGLYDLIARVRGCPIHPMLKETILKALKQEVSGINSITEALSSVREGPGSGENNSFATLVGAMSLLSFVLGVAYYYQ